MPVLWFIYHDFLYVNEKIKPQITCNLTEQDFQIPCNKLHNSTLDRKAHLPRNSYLSVAKILPRITSKSTNWIQW